MNRIVRNVAEQAWRPLLPSGLWFHGDVRDNFYYASYLFAASLDLEIDPQFNRQEGKRLAEEVLGRVFAIAEQGREDSDVRTLAAEPGTEAGRGESICAPVELMGSLMVFHRKFVSEMSEGLAAEFAAGLEHIYHGGFFASRSPCAIIMRLNIRRPS